MGMWNLHQWLRDFSGSANQNQKRRQRLNLPLRIETLEERVVPANMTFIWTGLGSDANWSTGANWQGGIAPNGFDPTDSLSFGGNAVQRNTVNDLTTILGSPSVFNSISISASGYSLAGDLITLGSGVTPASGNIVVTAGAVNNVIGADVRLAGPGAGNRQFVQVDTGGNLVISGSVSGNTGVELTKSGRGTLTLANDNSGFTGPIRVNNGLGGGVLVIANANALGSNSNSPLSVDGTTVESGSQLQVSGVAGPINENILINGLGISNDGALLNISGDNVWAGRIILDSNSAIGSNSGEFRITGQISDQNQGHDLTKEGVSVVTFVRDNIYRGITTVNNGTLRVEHNLALGTQDLARPDGTIVNQSLTKVGTLQLNFRTDNPFNSPGQTSLVILDEELTLNGTGVAIGGAAIGALSNLAGNNEYAAPVIIGTPGPTGSTAFIGVEAGDPLVAPSELIMSGVISGPVATFGIRKVRPGRLIFDNANTYTGLTRVAEGILNIRDSQGLGTTGGATLVNDGATLELEIDGREAFGVRPADARQFDAHGRDLRVDSVTGFAMGTDFDRLVISDAITLNGRGVGSTLNGGFGGQGALHSLSGINVWNGNITLADENADVAISVEADPNQRSGANYFTDDYSLTIGDNPLTGAAEVIDSDQYKTFVKRGTGHLILPTANTFQATLDIEEGWITAQNAASLGGRLTNTVINGLNNPRVADDPDAYLEGDTVQPETIVRSGAALHAKAPTPTGSLTLAENVILMGSGISHANPLLSGKGAMMSIGGNITLTGDVELFGTAGVGVEQVDPTGVSEMTSAGTMSNFSTFKARDSGNVTQQEEANVIDVGVTSGLLVVEYQFSSPPPASEGPNRMRIYYPPRGTPGSQLLFDSGLVANGANSLFLTGPSMFFNGVMFNSVGIPFNGTDTQVEIVMNDGGADGLMFWAYSVQVQTDTVTGGMTKFGSKRLRLQGDGSFTGAVTVQEGVITAQNDTAFGAQGGGITLNAGTALELGNGLATNNGGISGGIQIRGEQLTINSAGNVTNGAPIAPLTALGNGDHYFRGPITLNNDVNVSVGTNSRLSISGSIDDTGSLFPAGMTKIGAGELNLSGTSSYRGVTNVSQGVVTIQSSQALGTPDGGTVVSMGASLQVQGSVTVAGESLTIQGDGVGAAPSAIPIRWFENGPGPVTNGETPGNDNVTGGRVTSVTNDPTDERVIYISTAGGGAWKTEDGGRTWRPLIDRVIDGAGNPIAVQTMFTGSITVSRVDPRILYVATGEGNNSADSFYGRGILRSTDSGETWTLIAPTNIAGVNLFDRKAINKIVDDPTDANIIYVAVGNAGSGSPGVNTLTDVSTSGNNGIWKFDANAGTPWVNLTAGKGPTDDTTIVFSDLEDYTDVDVKASALGVNFLTMSIGSSVGSRVLAGGAPAVAASVFQNAAYISLNDGTSWTKNGFVNQEDQTVSGLTLRFPVAGNIKLSMSNPYTGPAGPNNPPSYRLYATVSYPREGFNTTFAAGLGFTSENNGNPNLEGRLRSVQRAEINFVVGTGYVITGWTPVTLPPDFMVDLDSTTGLNRGRGDFANAVAIDPLNESIIYVGGVGRNSGNGILRSIDNGQTWTDLEAPAVLNGDNAPHQYVHDFSFDRFNRLYAATDGGLWSLENPRNIAVVDWQNRNGDLSIAQFNSIASHPFDLNQALGGSQGGGVEISVGDLAWMQTDVSDGGQVAYDPLTPSTVYAIVGTPGQTLLRRSDQGGAPGTWRTLRVLSDPPPMGAPNRNGNVIPVAVDQIPLVVDQINPNRILVTDRAPQNNPNVDMLLQSIDGGTTFVNLQAPIVPTKIALAQFQGLFVDDPGFISTPGDFNSDIDKGADVYDPNTIYITDGNSVFVSKNSQVGNPPTWVNRTPGLPAGGGISDIIVDPRNRDIVYVVRKSFGNDQVFMSTNAGRNWTNISFNLPAVPAWSIVLDPRTGSQTVSPSGDLYIGNDNGVYVLRAGANSWSRLGSSGPVGSPGDVATGMPFVQVKDLELNLNLNTLTAGTYGRGMFTYSFQDVDALGGAMRVTSGSAVWTGNVTLVGNTTFGASGTQNLASGADSANLNILGVISDGGSGFTLDKIGVGTLTLSGANTYGGITTVREGVLASNNLNALGSFAAGTIVQSGAALEIQADLALEPITINGNGFTFNGHNSGSLRNSANNNTYTGPLTLGTNATIGVDSGSQLTITNVITDGAASLTLSKELTGTLVLSGTNTYDGVTNVNQGVLRATSSGALGSGAAGTFVLDGAQLQLAGNVTLPESLAVSGTGIAGSGAILNLSGNNTISGALTLASLPAFSPPSIPPANVSVNVLGAADTLTVSGAVNQMGGTFGLDKIGAGRLTLASSNTYGGTTNVLFGALRIQNGGGLGTTANGTNVSSGAQLELDGSFTVGAELLNLNGSGIAPASGGALQSISGTSTYGGNVVLQTNTTVGGLAGSSVTLTGIVSDPTLSTLTKVGQNTVTLAGANTYRGVTTVIDGVLGVANANALGAGTAGTTVLSDGTRNGTLQLSGGITVTTEDLTINGLGFSSIGALNNLSGTNTWSRLITMGSNTAVGATAGTLVLDQPLTDGASTFGLSKFGDGTVSFSGTTSNAYDGPTTVNQGTLLLNKTGGGVPFTGALNVGDGVGGVGTVLLGQANQIPDNVVVNVFSDGVLNLNGLAETVSTLQISNGSVTTGLGGTLNVGGLNMSGGTVTAAMNGQVVLTGDVIATSSASQTATINGPGTLSLGGASRTFNVTDGDQRVDLAVNAVIDDLVGEGVFKAGIGRMAVSANNTYVGTTSISGGDFEVTGSIGNVTLNNAAASVSGTGTIGTVSGSPAAMGAINPGLNVTGAGGTTGILSTDSLTLGATSGLSITINNQTPGSGYDQVLVSGAVALNGAQLFGFVGPAVNIGDQFTIIQTTGSPIVGRFAEPFGANIAFIGGRKFDVDYTDPTKVVLTLVQSTVSVGVDSATNPTVFGQPVTFRATVTPEPGSVSAVPLGSVTFTITGPSGTITQTVGLADIVGPGDTEFQARFTPTGPLLPGVYTVNVTYSGDSFFNGAAGTLSPLQVVNASTTTTTVTATPSPSNFGSPVTITAVVAGQFPGAVPTGTVNFSINGVLVPVTLVNGRASITTSNLQKGTNTITATYLGNDPTGGFNASSRTMTTFVNPTGTLPPPNPGDPLPPPKVPNPLSKTLVAFGADGGGSHVRVVDTATGQEKLSIFAYNPLYQGGVRVALGDVNGDGTLDVITGTGIGGGPHVKAFDGNTGAELLSFFAYVSTFTGGLYVASGDVNGDGFSDIITGAGPGAGPNVKVFDGRNGQEISSFFAYIPAFTGGVTVAAGDVDGDGFADIITGSAALATHVKVFNGRTGAEVQSFFAFNPLVTGGVSVGVGDFNGDGLADIVASPGSGGPHVRAFRGTDLVELASFFAFDDAVPNGIRVASVDQNKDGRTEFVVAQGFGGRVRRFNPITFALIDDTLPYNVTPIGVFVG